MIEIFGSYNYRNDTKLTYTVTADRAEIELEFTDEDPDYGTEILINGGDASSTIIDLCKEELNDITEFLDKTNDGVCRDAGGYHPEFDDLNNSTLIAFERLLQKIVEEEEE